MRVAIFTEVYLPAVNGVVTHIKTLKEGLEMLGHQVLIVAANSNVKKTQSDNNILYCPAIKLEKIYGYDVASPISADRLRMIKDFHPDIIHIQNEFGIGLSGAIMSKMLKIPLVYTMHTMYDDYVYYVAHNELAFKLLKGVSHKYAKFLADSASAVTGPSKKVEEYFKRCGVEKEITVIPNSVETEVFNRDNVSEEKRMEIRAQYGFSKDDLVFCFCGRMGQEKNIEVLLKYWAKNVSSDDGMKLLLIGGGPQLEEYRQLAQDLNISDTAKFTGRVEHADIPPYYAACDCYITASLTECHSISMMEGMATGMPVLTIWDELNSDQIQEGVNGFYFHDADEMYAHMLKLKELSREELEKIQRRSRETIVASGTQAIAERLLEIYDRAIKEYDEKRRHKKMSAKEKRGSKSARVNSTVRPKRKVKVKLKRVTKEEKKRKKSKAHSKNKRKDLRKEEK